MKTKKTVKMTLELNADQLHSLLSGFESKWDGGCNRSKKGLARSVVLAAERFDVNDQAFAFETIATAEIYSKLVALVSEFPEIEGDFSGGLEANSEREFFRAYEKVRSLLGIPDEDSAAEIRKRRPRARSQSARRVPERSITGAALAPVVFIEAKDRKLALELTREEVACLERFLREFFPDDIQTQTGLDEWQSAVEVLARDYDPVNWTDVTYPKHFGLMKLLKVYYRLCHFVQRTGGDPFDEVSIGNGQQLFDAAWTEARDYFRIPRNREPIKKV
jgi:hypothetical protein